MEFLIFWEIGVCNVHHWLKGGWTPCVYSCVLFSRAFLWRYAPVPFSKARHFLNFVCVNKLFPVSQYQHLLKFNKIVSTGTYFFTKRPCSLELWKEGNVKIQLYCIVLYCIVLYYTVLYCIAFLPIFDESDLCLVKGVERRDYDHFQQWKGIPSNAPLLLRSEVLQRPRPQGADQSIIGYHWQRWRQMGHYSARHLESTCQTVHETSRLPGKKNIHWELYKIRTLLYELRTILKQYINMDT